jgi:hypothetical protein
MKPGALKAMGQLVQPHLGVRRTPRANDLVHAAADDCHDGAPPRCGRRQQCEKTGRDVGVDEISRSCVVAVVCEEEKRDREVTYACDEVTMEGMRLLLLLLLLLWVTLRHET